MNMKHPLISIIVPVYNVEKYLDRCIHSLIIQTLKDIELIIVDDGSTDNCPQMCDEYGQKDSRIKVIHKNNEGLGLARNSGLDIASGQYVAFIDSDDFVDNRMFEKLLSSAEKNNADVVYCGYNTYGTSVESCKKYVSTEQIIQGQNNCLLFLKEMIGHDPDDATKYVRMLYSVWKSIYKKDVIDKYKIRFCSERQFISEDVIFHIDFLQHVNVINIIPDALYYYCLNLSSLTKKYKPGRFERDINFCKEVERKMELIPHIKSYKNHINALVLEKVQGTLSFEISNNSFLTALSAIRSICSSEYLLNAIKEYPTQSLPLKNKIFLWCICNRFSALIYCYYRFFRKGNR